MKNIIFLIMIISMLLIVIPATTFAAMDDYCSSPPYVTRTNAPNVIILMDNSVDMNNPSYTDAYTPSANYVGYFKPTGCYSYSGGKFVEVYKAWAVNSRTSFTASDNCPDGPGGVSGQDYGYLENGNTSTGVFRGNLMNWAVTSKYDILQKVIIGGNSESKIGNAHTLVSASGDWTVAGVKDNNTYSGCKFLVTNASLTISDVTLNSCTLIQTLPSPIAFWQRPLFRNIFAWFSKGFNALYTALFDGAKKIIVLASRALEEISIATKAWAAASIAIVSGALDGIVQQPYSLTLGCSGTGSECPNGTYSWSFSNLPSWITSTTYTSSGLRTNYRATISGTPAASGNYTFTATVTIPTSPSTVVSQNFTIIITAGPLQITTASPLPDGEEGVAYTATVNGIGGVKPYTWSAVGLPPGLSIDSATGAISGTPAADADALDTTYTVTVTLTDSNAIPSTISKTFALTIKEPTGLNSQNYTVKVILQEEPLTDVNGNDIYDSTVTGESYTDSNGNGQWDGKQGVFQKFWDDINPRARWGLAKFVTGGDLYMVACVPHSPASTFYTRVQNARPVDIAKLSKGLYGVLNYYGFSGSYFSSFDDPPSSFSGCTNSDPMDSVQCRKNFILVISSGSDVGPATGSNFTQADCTTVPHGNSTAPLVQNACFGYKRDLRDLQTPLSKQNVYTYVVNTMGSDATNNNILEDAALAGGGKYYNASSASQLENALTNAFTDILARAASGTAVSVLTTSARGIGSVIQAYFLPTKLIGTREVWWTGYMQNIWIDPADNLREDTTNDFNLKLGEDKVIKLYFDPTANETKAGLFTTDSEGNGGTLATCSTTDIKLFSGLTPLWEAGKKLALRNPSERTIFTSKNVIRGTSTTHTFTETPYPEFSTGMNATLLAALNDAAAKYTSENIVRYVRGECLETGVTGNTDCGASASSTYRDRRMTVSGGGTNGNVWKLGDIITSTPKVIGNTAQATYYFDYGDSSYYQFISSDKYKKRSAIAVVGANDGMLHAFRVGYLKDKSDEKGTLASTIKGIFKNFFNYNDDVNDRLGEEAWSFIPFNAFPYLKYLADPGYCHIYYNDLSVRVVEASLGMPGINGNPTDTKQLEIPGDGIGNDNYICEAGESCKSIVEYNAAAGGDNDGTCEDEETCYSTWRTIIVGGMRLGGACGTGGTPADPPAGTPANVGYSAYFAIDVTDPGNPIPLWEFSDADLGYVTTYPSIVRTGDEDVNGNWYVVIGSGPKQLPKSGIDISRSSTGYLYILNLKTGALVKKINLGHNAMVGDILAVDADKDYRSEKVYFGTAYKPAAWAGKFMRLEMPSDVNTICGTTAGTVDVTYANCTTDTTQLKTLFSGDSPFTASPDATKDASGNVWAYIGSGKYYSDVDEADTSQQIFIGFKDTGSTVSEGSATACPASCPGAALCDVTNCSTTGTVSATVQECLYNSGSFSLQDVVTSITNASSAPTTTVGWKIYLPSSERVISRPLAVGGLVDFLTYRPSADPCSYGGDSYLYAVDFITGVAPSNVAIRAPGATSATAGNVTVYKGMLLGPGAPPVGEAIILPPPKEGQEQLKKKIQVATGVIVETENKPVISVVSKIMHWLKK